MLNQQEDPETPLMLEQQQYNNFNNNSDQHDAHKHGANLAPIATNNNNDNLAAAVALRSPDAKEHRHKEDIDIPTTLYWKLRVMVFVMKVVALLIVVRGSFLLLHASW